MRALESAERRPRRVDDRGFEWRCHCSMGGRVRRHGRDGCWVCCWHVRRYRLMPGSRWLPRSASRRLRWASAITAPSTLQGNSSAGAIPATTWIVRRQGAMSRSLPAMVSAARCVRMVKRCAGAGPLAERRRHRRGRGGRWPRVLQKPAVCVRTEVCSAGAAARMALAPPRPRRAASSRCPCRPWALASSVRTARCNVGAIPARAEPIGALFRQDISPA